MGDRDSRRTLTPLELEQLLRELARDEATTAPATEDVLDYLEGHASEAQIARVHHALAHSGRLRGELLEQLREIHDFDRAAVERAVQDDAENPVPELVPIRRPTSATRRIAFRPPRWSWALGAAAAAALLVLGQWPSNGPVDPTDGLSVLAAARAFETEMVRGHSDHEAVAVQIPAGVDRVQLAVWVPESWAEVPASRISATIVGPDGEEVPVRSAKFDFHAGDPALLVLVRRPELGRGQLTVRLRRTGPDGAGPELVEAHFRLEQ